VFFFESQEFCRVPAGTFAVFVHTEGR